MVRLYRFAEGCISIKLRQWKGERERGVASMRGDEPHLFWRQLSDLAENTYDVFLEWLLPSCWGCGDRLQRKTEIVHGTRLSSERASYLSPAHNPSSSIKILCESLSVIPSMYLGRNYHTCEFIYLFREKFGGNTATFSANRRNARRLIPKSRCVPQHPQLWPLAQFTVTWCSF